jgi:creatinine amidohydrolase/Fe(II)-dependent formamide hydrolase-like protein
MSFRETRSLLVACLLLLSPCVVRAQVPDTVFLEELTWTELRDQIRSGKTTILVPIGGTEQSGPHMALGKHNVRVRALSAAIARGLGNALVAPVLAYVPEGRISPPEGHMRFPGTITIPDATFAQLLESAARSFKAHGFKDIVFLGDHSGYQATEKRVADRLNREWAATPVRAYALLEYYRLGEVEYAQLLKSRGFTEQEIGTHAGLSDTSRMLAVDPHLVRSESMQDPPSEASGVHGDPRRATAALGQVGVDLVVGRTIAAIKAATTR